MIKDTVYIKVQETSKQALSFFCLAKFFRNKFIMWGEKEREDAWTYP